MGPALHDDGLPPTRPRSRCAFGGFYEKDLVYQALKSVRWCFTDRTALAEAELEYEERDRSGDLRGLSRRRFRAAGRAELLIWTTTPWTIPSNVAIAVHPDETYAIVEAERPALRRGREARGERGEGRRAGRTGRSLATLSGDGRSTGVRYRHPLPPECRGELTPEEEARSFRVVLADYVTMDTGTGLVHTATGHGEDDFLTGQREGLPILSPVDEAGRLHDGREVPGEEGAGCQPRDRPGPRRPPAPSSPTIPNFRHEYPHCWRCKNPVIFRATVQWFVRLDDPQTDVRQGALAAIAGVHVDPGLGRGPHRRHGREPARVGRLRASGAGALRSLFSTPCATASAPASIPGATRPPSSGTFFEHVAGIFRAEGGDAWYARPAADFLPARRGPAGLAPADFQAETDILDVWFDSGVSHIAVLRSGRWPELSRTDGGRPADLYLEGHDQHRGWFQSSLLTSVALYGDAPYAAVITHGFVLDGQRPQDVQVARQRRRAAGADQEVRRRHPAVLGREPGLPRRRPDLRGDPGALRRGLPEGPQHGAVPDLQPLRLRSGSPRSSRRPVWSRSISGRWPRRGSSRGGSWRRTRATSSIVVYHLLVNFCATTLSAFYCDILKDRLYASAAASPERRSAQTAL